MFNYYYDILLNFNKEYIEPFEWQKEDKITHFAKILLLSVEPKIIKDLIKFDFIINENIKDKIPKYNRDDIVFIISDGNNCLAVKQLNNSSEISSIEYEDEKEINAIIKEKVSEFNLEYILKEERKLDPFVLRTEKPKKQYIIYKLDDMKDNDLNNDFLNYLYYEVFNNNEYDRKKIITHLKNSTEISKIYDLIKLFVE